MAQPEASYIGTYTINIKKTYENGSWTSTMGCEFDFEVKDPCATASLTLVTPSPFHENSQEYTLGSVN